MSVVFKKASIFASAATSASSSPVFASTAATLLSRIQRSVSRRTFFVVAARPTLPAAMALPPWPPRFIASFETVTRHCETIASCASHDACTCARRAAKYAFFCGVKDLVIMSIKTTSAAFWFTTRVACCSIRAAAARPAALA